MKIPEIALTTLNSSIREAPSGINILNRGQGEYNSLSQWYLQANQLLPARHGEKFSSTTNLDLFGSNHSMEKQFLEMDMDPASFICVNPYEINPVSEKSVSHSPTLTVDLPLKGNQNVIGREWEKSYGNVVHSTPKKIKLEMEEFSDLSLFLPKHMSTNYVDELNTPIFDKETFDFDISVYPKGGQSKESHVKLESETYYRNTCTLTNAGSFRNFPLNTQKSQWKENANSDVALDNNVEKPDINRHLPQLDNLSAYTCQISPSYDNTNNTYNRPCQHVPTGPKYFGNPEDSNSSVITMSSGKQSMLSLDTSLRPPNSNKSLDTPHIIEEVVDLESSGFNILDLVASEDISYVSSEDIFLTPSSISFSVPESNATNTDLREEFIPQKRPRKRRTHSDDDEDYVPPTKRNVVVRRNVKRLSQSDSNGDSEIKVKPKPRGRPPKRTESVSSDCSKDSDASKYRELRDKNNEASRRSRLKRRMKEQEMDKEADELISKNIKLKAQVEELEKMVTNFRDNLFKLMIKK
ncbi:hypothetical protein NQ317_004210 [Molorchus minor]|uniref:BZIP domain-containing protein n=1 Tax=Molorchus minor TaxID=1323400 RepID=A0ABQ9JND1_9CUCU|nr:hypothetical protein NQ317_004210 [Molorchus minor]